MQLKKYQLINNEEKQNKGKTEKRGTTEAVINKYPEILPHLLQRRKSFPQRNIGVFCQIAMKQEASSYQ